MTKKAKETEKSPENLEECFAALDEVSSDSDRRYFKSQKKGDASACFHHTLGRSLRNGWNLWDESAPLHKYFLNSGIFHADDMSGIIIDSYHRYLNGKDIDLDGQIKFYKDFWAASGSERQTLIFEEAGTVIINDYARDSVARGKNE